MLNFVAGPPTSRMIDLAIFDDNRDQLDALRAVLGAAPEIVIVGVFQSAVNAIADVEWCKPDVILMDIDMPEVDGIQATAILQARFPKIRILMLTVIEDNDRIFQAIQAGADGYFLKQTDPDRLLQGIKDVMDGGAPMSLSVARRVLRMMEVGHTTKANEFKLSDREKDILALLVEGHTYKGIASKLLLSYATVNRHVSSVYLKLHVHSASEAVALALRKGLA